jgi:hypothetical protein
VAELLDGVPTQLSRLRLVESELCVLITARGVGETGDCGHNDLLRIGRVDQSATPAGYGDRAREGDGGPAVLRCRGDGGVVDLDSDDHSTTGGVWHRGQKLERSDRSGNLGGVLELVEIRIEVPLAQRRGDAEGQPGGSIVTEPGATGFEPLEQQRQGGRQINPHGDRRPRSAGSGQRRIAVGKSSRRGAE